MYNYLIFIFILIIVFLFFLLIFRNHIKNKATQDFIDLLNTQDDVFFDNKNLEKIKELIKKGADINIELEGDKTPLFLSLSKGHKELTEILIKNGADVHFQNKSGLTPLLMAINREEQELAKLIIEKGADVNISKSSKSFMNPLLMAIDKEQPELAKLIIEKGADVSTIRGNTTPLLLAIENNFSKLAKLLIEQGAPITSNDSHRNTPLHKALKVGWLEVAKLLVEKGADINAKNDEGETPLIIATAKGFQDKQKNLKSENDIKKENYYFEFIKFLIEKGADINAKTNYGNSALFLALLKGHEKCSEYLLKMGANYKEMLQTERDNINMSIEEFIIFTFKRSKMTFKTEKELKEAFQLFMKDAGFLHIFKISKENSKKIISLFSNIIKKQAEDYEQMKRKTKVANNIIKAKALSDEGVQLISRGDTEGAWEKWLDACEADKTWAIPHFNIAKAYLDSIKHSNDFDGDLNKAQKHLGIAEALAKKKLHSEDSQVLAQLETMKTRIKLRGTQQLQQLMKDKDFAKPQVSHELISALSTGDISTIKIHLDKGLDIDSVVMDGNTLLSAAAYFGHYDIVKLLVERGAEVNTTNVAGHTALTAARIGKHHSIEKLLKENGAKEFHR